MLNRLDREVVGWNKHKYFEMKAFQAGKGIPAELVGLCLLPGVGKTMARHLYSVDVKSRADVIEAARLNDLASDEEVGMAARGLADGTI
jgi:hypothetical protein